MTLDDVKGEVREYFYMEDDTIIDASIACIIANRLKFGTPVWLVLIGASSGGKSQILKPLANTDKKWLHSVDDITESTFLSSAKLGSKDNGKKIEPSFLKREVGKDGMLVMSDLTVLFSKNKESRDAVLSQLRMLYDGELIRQTGNLGESISWKGYLGIIAGSTPSIYRHFEEVADMGERFMYWRLKPYDERKATHLALSRKLSGNSLDDKLSTIYGEYIKQVVRENVSVKHEELITKENQDEIVEIALFSERIRTSVFMDFQKKDIERIPVPAFPMRTALQLMNVAKGLAVMRGRELDDKDMDIIRWMGWSLANEERRACLTALASDFNFFSTQAIADEIGLSTVITKMNLQSLAALEIIERGSNTNKIEWRLSDKYFKRVCGVCDNKKIKLSTKIDEEDIEEVVASVPF